MIGVRYISSFLEVLADLDSLQMSFALQLLVNVRMTYYASYFFNHIRAEWMSHKCYQWIIARYKTSAEAALCRLYSYVKESGFRIQG